MNKAVSPSRTYVAMCNKPNFTGYYFKKFSLPDDFDCDTADDAAWYFLNRLNFEACIDGVLTFEDYSNITDEV